MEQKVIQTIKKYALIKNGDNIVVGVSGGPDSMALLNLLINLKNSNIINFNIYVAHINHGLRKEAQEETAYVQEFCKKNDVPCYIKVENVQKLAEKQKIGTEEAGRKLRYNFFDEVAKQVNANKIATAHTANDNAETVLMNIIRGTGPSGLKGIEPIRNNYYIRPIIECTRKEIESYCNKEKLNPKYDKTNSENIYTRNRIRNLLIPYIEKEFNPQIITSLNKLSYLAANENKFLEKIVDENYNKIRIDESIGNKEVDNKNTIILSLKEFNKLDLVIKNRLVLYTINKLLGTSQNIEKIHIEDIIKLCENNIGNKYLVPNKKIKILVNKGKIFFIKMEIL